MSFIGKAEIISKILDVNRCLGKESLEVVIIHDSFRDYQGQFELQKNGAKKGKGIIYYSPKRRSFKVRVLNSEDKSYKDAVEKAFGIETKPGLVGYVDGSFIQGAASYGAVILKDDRVIAELSGVLDKEDAAYHQIGGELRGALEVIRWAQNNGYKELTICYDYKGVEKFATGRWKRENRLAILYHDEVNRSGIRITWQKVAAHTGVKWNEKADELAKEAARQNPTSVSLPKAERLTERLSQSLLLEGLDFENRGVVNGQYVRLVIFGKKPVYFDLYDTKNRPLKPYIHGSDEELIKRMKLLYNRVRKTENA